VIKWNSTDCPAQCSGDYSGMETAPSPAAKAVRVELIDIIPAAGAAFSDRTQLTSSWSHSFEQLIKIEKTFQTQDLPA
jgi:hypothetical protein